MMLFCSLIWSVVGHRRFEDQQAKMMLGNDKHQQGQKRQLIIDKVDAHLLWKFKESFEDWLVFSKAIGSSLIVMANDGSKSPPNDGSILFLENNLFQPEGFK